MALRFYNTLTRELQPFEPVQSGRVGIYACGPTVYRAPHVGNYRTFLFNDLLHRYLEWKGYEVRFVMNITDVDDRTIDRALAESVSLEAYTAPIAQSFLDDLDRLGARPADSYPYATEHIDQMVGLLQRLVDNGHAYVAEDDGSLYFQISTFPDYGKLSRIDLGEIRAGAGLEERGRQEKTGKRDPADFTLWKAAKEIDEHVDAAWDTPWGRGRPGWHLECSAMSMAELGESFDIHTGGEDLVFPHHEGEIAQSEGATGRPFVRYWLHVKHLKVNGEKMSKSLGNDYSLDDLLERGHAPEEVRYLLLSAHYRRELNFTFDGLEDARQAIRRLLTFEDRLEALEDDEGATPSRLPELADRALAGFEAALDDDLNTSNALAALFTFLREVNAELDARGAVTGEERDRALDALRSMDRVLGIIALARRDARLDEDLAAWVEEKVEAREAARADKDWATADAIRDELTEAGVEIEDTPQGTRWTVARPTVGKGA